MAKTRIGVVSAIFVFFISASATAIFGIWEGSRTDSRKKKTKITFITFAARVASNMMFEFIVCFSILCNGAIWSSVSPLAAFKSFRQLRIERQKKRGKKGAKERSKKECDARLRNEALARPPRAILVGSHNAAQQFCPRVAHGRIFFLRFGHGVLQADVNVTETDARSVADNVSLSGRTSGLGALKDIRKRREILTLA